MLTITKEKKISAVKTEDGAGVRIRRLFPSHALDHYDPFVLFDEFFLQQPAEFPLHPHRGFEAITYLFEGGFHHKDTLGNDATVLQGGAQRFSAGKGLEHAELPGTRGLNHGVQLWINLPQNKKGMEPEYQQVDAKDLPEADTQDAIVRTVAGGESPLKLHSDIIFLDVQLKTNRSFIAEVSENLDGFVYFVKGGAEIEDNYYGPGDAFLLNEIKSTRVYTVASSRFLLIAGIPLGQEIRQFGSFVD